MPKAKTDHFSFLISKPCPSLLEKNFIKVVKVVCQAQVNVEVDPTCLYRSCECAAVPYRAAISKMATARVSVNTLALFLALSLPQTGLSLALGYTLLLGEDISRALASCFQNGQAGKDAVQSYFEEVEWGGNKEKCALTRRGFGDILPLA